jgi:hypothetical protein
MHAGKASRLCTSWQKSFAAYFFGLDAIDVWPLELHWPKHSVSSILSLLQTFSCEETGCCDICRVDWEPVVQGAAEIAERYFGGLCIDCMDRSRLPKGRDPDETYWAENGVVEGRWDKGCRIRHGQPTWYHSWCGRDEHKQKLVRVNEH